MTFSHLSTWTRARKVFDIGCNWSEWGWLGGIHDITFSQTLEKTVYLRQFPIKKAMEL